MVAGDDKQSSSGLEFKLHPVRASSIGPVSNTLPTVTLCRHWHTFTAFGDFNKRQVGFYTLPHLAGMMMHSTHVCRVQSAHPRPEVCWRPFQQCNGRFCILIKHLIWCTTHWNAPAQQPVPAAWPKHFINT